jgi:hypothetical protein
MTIGRYAPWANGKKRRTWLSDALNLRESLAQRTCRRSRVPVVEHVQGAHVVKVVV